MVRDLEPIGDLEQFLVDRIVSTTWRLRRIGSADYRCTQDDLDLLYQLRSQQYYEAEVLPYVSWEDISEEAIDVYRRIRSQIDPNAEELRLDDQELLLSLRAAVKQKGEVLPTIGGLLLFGTKAALRRELPMDARVDYIVVEGSEWVPSGSKRYELAIEYREALVTLMPKLHAEIMSDLPKAFGLDEEKLRRVDTPQIPREVVREALANALMHKRLSRAPTYSGHPLLQPLRIPQCRILSKADRGAR